MPITDKEKILERRAEHFDRVLNRPSFIKSEAIDRACRRSESQSLSLWTLHQPLTRLSARFASCPEVKHQGNTQFQLRSTNSVLAPTLLSLMFSAMLSEAFRNSDACTQPYIGIRCRTDGYVFNLRRLQAKTVSWQQTPSTDYKRIGHFRVAFILYFKARSRALPLIREWSDCVSYERQSREERVAVPGTVEDRRTVSAMRMESWIPITS